MHNETRGVIFFRSSVLSSNETDSAMKTPQSRPLQSPLTYLCYYETQKFSVLSLQALNPVRAQCALNKSISPKLPCPPHSLNKMRPTWQHPCSPLTFVPVNHPGNSCLHMFPHFHQLKTHTDLATSAPHQSEPLHFWRAWHGSGILSTALPPNPLTSSS